MYRPGNNSIEKSNPATLIKQQRILLQQINRTEVYPNDAVINDFIIAIKKEQKEKHKLIVTIDGNEPFESVKGGIAKLFRKYQLYDPLIHRHDQSTSTITYIRSM